MLGGEEEMFFNVREESSRKNLLRNESDWSAPASAAKLTSSRCQAKRSRLTHPYKKTYTHTI